MAAARLLESVDEILQQVEPVRDVDRVGRARSPAFGVGLSAVATDDLHPRMRVEPRRERRGLAIGQQVNHAPALEVDEDRAVALAAPHRPVIDAEHARPVRGRLTRRALEGTPYEVIALAP